jgi:hypothetical protein
MYIQEINTGIQIPCFSKLAILYHVSTKTSTAPSGKVNDFSTGFNSQAAADFYYNFLLKSIDLYR